MASELQRVAQGLVECLDQMPQVVAYLHLLASKCRDNAMHIADFHSAQPAARNAALMLDEAARRCDEAADLATRTHATARTWAAQMVGGATGGGAASSSRIGAPRQRLPARTLTPTEVAQKGRRLPVRHQQSGHRLKTRGIWTDRAGADVDLVSGKDAEQELAKQFADQQRALGSHLHSGLAITSHVEVKFAMLMRERGLSSECIVINNKPCDDKDGCDRLLPDFLPPGASLTVYGPGGYMKTYYGKADLQ